MGGDMRSARLQFAAAIVATLTVLAVPVLAKVDVKVAFDKTFNFKDAKTWSWSEEPGHLMMARTQDDKPDAVKARLDPIVIDAVEQAMTQRGMQKASSYKPALVMTYYVLLSTNMTAQTIGQFLPATVNWGLPFFPPATQSLKYMNAGSLVLDLAANGTVVWRGLADTKIAPDATDAAREAIVREGVRELIKKLPTK
jgi:hypothetical protein